MSKPSHRQVLKKLFVLYLTFLLCHQLGSQLKWQARAAGALINGQTGDSLALAPNPASAPSSPPPQPQLPEEEASALSTISDKWESKIGRISEINCTATSSSYSTPLFYCNCSYQNETVCHITMISLSNIDITTDIPQELGDLPYLRYLDLSNNKFHGPIPPALGYLDELRTLDLSRNQLTGQIPAGFINLVSLYLQYNFLDGRIPSSLGSLTNLNVLHLQFNNLSHNIPDELGKLVNLEKLDISENRLRGELPRALGGLTSIRYFLAAANSLSGKIPDTYRKLTGLTYFSISGNDLSGPLPVDIIKRWTNISYLNLMGNNFKGNLPKEVFNLPYLEYLFISDLENATFELPSETEIFENASYSALILRNCSIKGSIPKYIGEMKSLYYLDLSFNNLTGGLPEDMKSELYYMSFSRNKLNGAIPDWIFESVDTRIDLSFNNFSATDSQTSENPDLNLFACCRSSAPTEPERGDPLNVTNTYCHGNEQKYHSLFINCGGGETTVNGVTFEQDNNTARLFTSPNKNWAYSSSGDYLEANASSSDYMKNMTCGVSVSEAPLYDRARVSPVSLKYYAFCLREGKYNVSLKFAEIVYNEDTDYTSLRKRAFDIYVQGEKVDALHDFDIRESAQGSDKPFTKNFTAEITKRHTLLTIHMYWHGKGSFGEVPGLSFGNGPDFNGPLISAISVIPDFEIGDGKLHPWQIALIVICPTIAVLLLAFAWKYWLRRKYSSKIIVGEDKRVTLKELIDATGKFSNKKMIGSGSLGKVYKAELQGAQLQGPIKTTVSTTVAVKKLSSHFKENIQKLKKEIILLHELSHENLIKLFDYHIEKDLQLLVYEYLENGSLEDALIVDSNTRSRKYPWDTRFKICLGIARGLKYLHEHHNLKIIAHMNIKAVNILLDGDFEPKISHFGFSHLFVEADQLNAIKREVSQGYMAPEYFQGIMSPKLDVYSFGVILLEIVSWKKNVIKSNHGTEVLVNTANQKHAQGNLEDMIDKTSGPYDTQEALIILKLAVKCTNIAPIMRPSMSDVVSVLEKKKTIDDLASAAASVGENIKGSGDVAYADSLGTTSTGLASSPSTSSPSTRGR